MNDVFLPVQLASISEPTLNSHTQPDVDSHFCGTDSEHNGCGTMYTCTCTSRTPAPQYCQMGVEHFYTLYHTTLRHMQPGQHMPYIRTPHSPEAVSGRNPAVAHGMKQERKWKVHTVS